MQNWWTYPYEKVQGYNLLKIHEQALVAVQRANQLENKVIQLQNENAFLRRQISIYQKQYEAERADKKIRRSFKELRKQLTCPFHRCNRAYASKLALNLHMRAKHNAGTKTYREQLAKKIVEAQEKGLPTPKIDIVFPPHYLENYRKNGIDRTIPKEQDQDYRLKPAKY